MADKNVPVFLKDSSDELVRVGWAEQVGEGEYSGIEVDTEGPGKEFYDLISRGPAQGFTFGEPVTTEENN